MSNSSRSLLSDTISGVRWVAIDKWSNRVMGLLVLTVLGRLLDPTEFGLVAIASGVMSLAGIFSEQGFGRALIQRDSLPRIYPSTTFWVSAGTSIFLSLFLILLAPAIAKLFGDDALRPVIQILSLGLVINALSSTPASLLERDFKFKALAIRRFVGTLSGGVAAIAAGLVGLGVWSLVIQTLVSGLVGLIVLWSASSWRPRLEFSIFALRNMWSVGISIMAMGIVGIANSQVDRLLIGTVLDAEAVGYYFMAIRVVGIMVDLFSSIFSGIALTTFSKLQNDQGNLLKWFYKLTSLSSAISLPVFGIALVTAPIMVPFVFGKSWDGSITLFQILCLLGALNAVAYFDRTVLIAVGKAKQAFLLLLGQTILGVILVAISLPWGVVAVATAVTLRQYLYWPSRLFTLKKYIDLDPKKYFLQWLRPFLISAAATAACLSTTLVWPRLIGDSPLIYITLCILIFVGIYGGGAWIFEPQYFKDLQNVFKRRF